ncbi:unnamed protein product [Rangifer tarandus platyrhynchus]|uniref:Uncharacterized protein n=1 Tax=Rangifer tarandus platyrhynchus TaxID=3082113 RepID=A0AC59Z5V4_RANTA
MRKPQPGKMMESRAGHTGGWQQTWDLDLIQPDHSESLFLFIYPVPGSETKEDWRFRGRRERRTRRTGGSRGTSHHGGQGPRRERGRGVARLPARVHTRTPPPLPPPPDAGRREKRRKTDLRRLFDCVTLALAAPHLEDRSPLGGGAAPTDMGAPLALPRELSMALVSPVRGGGVPSRDRGASPSPPRPPPSSRRRRGVRVAVAGLRSPRRFACFGP